MGTLQDANGHAATPDARRYREMELALVAELRELHDIAANVGHDDAARTIEAILKDIEQHSFRIAVVGEFRRGKSTFINALLGKAILPSDILPTSATLNRVTYGLTPKIHIKFRATAEQPARVVEVPLDEIANYVTKLTPEAAAMAATVEEAVVTYPASYCKHNVDIIDTPGLSDEENLTAVTKAVLPKVHAAIMVIMATAPFAESEAQFLDHLLGQNLSKVIFVVSGIDRIEEQEDRARVVTHIKQRIEKRLTDIAATKFGDDPARRQEFLSEVGAVRVFGVSGYQALKAKERRDEALRVESGFVEMEAALDRFLAEESGAIALQSWVNQLLPVATELGEKIDEGVAACRRRQGALKSNCEMSAALAEVLRQMLEADARQLEQTFGEVKAVISELPGAFADGLAEAAEDVIGSHRVESDDFLPENSAGFHARLGEKLQAAALDVGRRLALQAQARLNAAFEGELKKLVRTGVAFDNVTRQIETLARDFDERIKIDSESSLARALSSCESPSPAELEESIRLHEAWVVNLFRQVRLPAGSFNWASQTLKERSFKTDLKRMAAAEIKSQLVRQGVGEHVSAWAQRCFGQLRLKLDDKRAAVESLQFKLYGGTDHAETLIAQRVADLGRMRDKLSHITRGKQAKVSI